MKKYKDWNVFEALPKGWKLDNSSGSPLHGYDFCTDGKSILNGGKRALVKSIRKGTPHIQHIDKQPLESKNEIIEKELGEGYSFPAKTANTLARKKFQEHLLKEIMFDLMVCEIEGWDKKEYITEIKKLINSIDLSNKKDINKHLNSQTNLFN